MPGTQGQSRGDGSGDEMEKRRGGPSGVMAGGSCTLQAQSGACGWLQGCRHLAAMQLARSSSSGRGHSMHIK